MADVPMGAGPAGILAEGVGLRDLPAAMALVARALDPDRKARELQGVEGRVLRVIETDFLIGGRDLTGLGIAERRDPLLRCCLN